MDDEVMTKAESVKRVNILGAEYLIFVDSFDNEKRYEEDNFCGWCDSTSKEIHILDIRTAPKRFVIQSDKPLDDMYRTLRHEIVHAFMYESGVAGASWGNNEELVEWLAWQIDKIYEVSEIGFYGLFDDIENKEE